MNIISLGWAGLMTMFTFTLASVVWARNGFQILIFKYLVKNKNFRYYIMALVLKVFPYANAEIVGAAVTCFFMTLLGLSLGFALLKIQGE